MSVTVTINGETRQFDDSVSIAVLLTGMGLDPAKIAVERNLEIVSRSQYDATKVSDGDRLEIVAAPEGYLLRPRRVNHSLLAPLRGSLRKGHATFNIQSFRKQAHDTSLRD